MTRESVGLARAEKKLGVFDHVDLPVSDIEATTRFYRIVLEPLGYRQTSTNPPEFGALSFVHSTAPKQLHLAFIAESQAAVDLFHAAGVEAGYLANGEPGPRAYAADYYAAYLLDPDGHNVEAVYRSPETRSRWAWLGAGVVSAAND
jgi:catechol 2,3-dioxygenase-like lactoylglutathione lyase family enzyme